MPQIRALVFTGHRIDAPGRARPRFPPAAEALARRMIRDAVAAVAEQPGPPLSGVSGAASGGDILFHEVCDELGIPTEVHLAKPPADYIEASVADGGPDWIARFAAITASRPVYVLPEGHGDAELDIWDRGNLEMLEAAAEKAGDQVTLIALWNGQGGDGPGGTADMVKRIRKSGGQAVVLDARRLLAGSPSEYSPADCG